MAGAIPKKSPVAIIMAGIPGAGKTEFVNRIILAETNLKNATVIDLDKIVESFPGYKPGEYYKYRRASSILLDAILDTCLKRKLDFVLDGTFSHKKGIDNINRSLSKGFEVNLFLIDQAPSISWEITKARQLLTGRPIERDGFQNAMSNIAPNVRKALSQFGDNNKFLVSIIKKDNLNNYSYIENRGEVEKYLEIIYNSYKERIDHE